MVVPLLFFTLLFRGVFSNEPLRRVSADSPRSLKDVQLCVCTVASSLPLSVRDMCGSIEEGLTDDYSD